MDPWNQIITESLSNECLDYKNKKYFKNLEYLNRDLSKVIVIDKNVENVFMHRDNVIQIPKYYGIDNDKHLNELLPLLKCF